MDAIFGDFIALYQEKTAYPNPSLFTHHLWRFPSTHPGQSKQPWDLEMADDPLNTPRIFFFVSVIPQNMDKIYKHTATRKNTTFGQI